MGYQVIKVPKLPQYNINDPTVHALATNLRRIRLLALRTSPEAFASSYHDEEKRDLSQTVERLAAPNAQHFAIVNSSDQLRSAGPADSILRALTECAWMGLIIIRDPVSHPHQSAGHKVSPHVVHTETRGRDADSDLHFELNGTFVHPDVRGMGLGKALLEATFDEARAQRSTSSQNIIIRVLVNTENSAACQLYASVGFEVVGEESYFQRTWSSDHQSAEIPRVCHIMERVV